MDMTRYVGFLVVVLVPLVGRFGGVARPMPALAASCPVTLPSPSTVPPASLDPAVRPSQPDWLWYGSAYLWTQIPPDGLYHVNKAVDGMMVKVPWFRMVPGRLAIHGHPVGARRPQVKPIIPTGYGASGFQPAGIRFPRTGCWRITGTVAGHGISYVVKVTRRS